MKWSYFPDVVCIQAQEEDCSDRLLELDLEGNSTFWNLGHWYSVLPLFTERRWWVFENADESHLHRVMWAKVFHSSLSAAYTHTRARTHTHTHTYIHTHTHTHTHAHTHTHTHTHTHKQNYSPLSDGVTLRVKRAVDLIMTSLESWSSIKYIIYSWVQRAVTNFESFMYAFRY